MRLGLLLMLVASPLAAQSVRSRLEARVPMAAVPTVDSLVQVAAREGLPTEPLVQKALEGGAKHVSAPRIGAAAQEMLEQLRDARALLVRAGDAPPATAAEVTTIYAALKRGLPGPVVERVVAALPQEPRGSALHSVADLAARGFAVRDVPVRRRVSTVKRARVARAIPLEVHAHDSSHAHHAGVARRPRDRRGAAALADAGPDAGG